MLNFLRCTAIHNRTNYIKVSKLAFQSIRTTSNNADAKDALNIEASLFENSTLKHAPVSVRQVLRHKKDHRERYHESRDTVQKQQKYQKNVAKSVKPVQKAKLIDDAELGMQFYRDSKLLTPILTEARSQRRRDKSRMIVLEGRRLIEEAFDCNLRLHTLVFNERDQLMEIKDKASNAQRTHKSKIFKAPRHELKMWSALTTPPGLIGIFEKPTTAQMEKQLQEQEVSSKSLPITVICDNVREPNNLGSIIRSCAAIPCTQVIVTKQCCDPWESKALRGGCGGHFRLLVHDEVSWPEIQNLFDPQKADDDFQVFIAENNLEKVSKRQKVKVSNYKDLQDVGGHNVVIVGGESHGVSEEAYNFLESSGKGKCLCIPLTEGVDSLNVASALTLILYELRDQLLKSKG